MRTWLVTTLAIAVTLYGPAAPVAARELSSYAFVNEDGSLRIRNRTVYLHGILIPPTEYTCRTFIRPVRCGTRAALALDFKISSSFVHCQVKSENPDRSLIAACEADGVDLAAYLLKRGWAAALSNAPPLYTVLERIARTRGIGIWGFSGDNFR